jgi:threonine/homoserine/homoserine lactone efflux protein
MELHTILAFSIVATLAILSPGPAVLLSLRNGTSLGARAVAWSALGNISGVCCLSIAAILGLGVVLTSSVILFNAVKIAGAAYLIYIGIRHLLGRNVLIPAETGEPISTTPRSPHALYREGFLIAATNPKAVLFFTALFPQFINAKAAIFPQFFILTAVFMAISYALHLIYALMAARAKTLLAKPFFASWFNRSIGAAFVAFGSLLLSLKRQSP